MHIYVILLYSEERLARFWSSLCAAYCDCNSPDIPKVTADIKSGGVDDTTMREATADVDSGGSCLPPVNTSGFDSFGWHPRLGFGNFGQQKYTWLAKGLIRSFKTVLVRVGRLDRSLEVKSVISGLNELVYEKYVERVQTPVDETQFGRGEDSWGISVEDKEAIVMDMDSACEKASVHVDTSTHAAELCGQDRGKQRSRSELSSPPHPSSNVHSLLVLPRIICVLVKLLVHFMISTFSAQQALCEFTGDATKADSLSRYDDVLNYRQRGMKHMLAIFELSLKTRLEYSLKIALCSSIPLSNVDQPNIMVT